MESQKQSLRVITRNSNLAQKQVEEVFSNFPELNYTLIPVESFGDKNKDISLLNNVIPDIFTRELDNAILENKADIAIHSAKDLPYPLPIGLEIYALFEAFDKTDALISRNNQTLKLLPLNAKIGTSSFIRKNELLQFRNDFQIISIRGTIEERIALVENGTIDALIVATCALKRLGIENKITEILPFETHPLQGNLAIIGKQVNNKLKAFFEKYDIRKKFGTIYLTGFGPGDPELLTVKAVKRLSNADIIYYDDLIDKIYINEFKAEKIYVGKRKDNHSKEQDEINQLLYKAALSGKNVVRLKGGDPMIFAHGGEEIEYLQERLINVEVIPGISTGIAAASISKIPLTHREISSSVTFISGNSENISNMPNSGTIICYMGATNISSIAKVAIQKGWRPNTPVALIYNVSYPSQQEFYSTLKELTLGEKSFPTPLIIIIGDVVGLRYKKAENIVRPNILVTGTDSQSFSNIGNIIHQPLIDIRPVENSKSLKNIIDYLHEYDHIIFTSKFAVHYLMELLGQYNKNSGYISSLTLTSIGEVTTTALNDYGIIPNFQPKEESSEGIINLFKANKIKGQVIFIPRSEIALPILPDGLRAIGNSVITLALYQNKPMQTKPINLKGINYIAFSSPSGVDSFMQVYGEIPENINFIAKGKVTLTRMIEAGFPKNSIKSIDLSELYPLEYEI
jgi:uroporphyrinogen III methyltransferase/synthase